MKRSLCGVLIVAAAWSFSAAANAGLASPTSPPGRESKIDLTARAIVRAKHIAVGLTDLPQEPPKPRLLAKAWYLDAQWKPGLVNKKGLSLACQGHTADLSRITLEGGWSTRFDRDVSGTSWVLTSAVVVLASPSQARLGFDDTDAWTTRYCFVQGERVGNARVVSVRRVQPPRVADQQAEFRIRWLSRRRPGRREGTTIVLLRRGRIFVELTFDWGGTPMSASFIESIAKKIAVRAT